MSRLHRFLAACVTAYSAMSAPPDQIAGTVIDLETGQPISHARVTAVIWASRLALSGDVLVVLTGDDGRFRFSGLPKGECEVTAEKSGYGKKVLSNHVLNRPDDLSVPLTFRLSPVGGLTVRVVDQSGVAVSGAQIAFLPRGEENQPWAVKLHIANAAKDGTRRVSSGGSYRVVALSPGTGNLPRAHGQTFLPTYYPGTTSASQAAWIDVPPGKEIDADLHVTMIPSHEIRGHLGFTGTLTQLSILPAGNANDYDVNWGLVQFRQDSPEFRISGLAPGSYVISADGCPGTACNTVLEHFRKSVQILNADIDNLVISEADRLPGK
jgi:hypothetical protein